MPTKSIPIQKLRRVCKPAGLKFKSTDDLPLLDDIIGQPRALRAIDFGIDVRGPGFNIFVLGQGGTGRMTTVEHFLAKRAAAEPTPSDWVYVHNFKDPLRPRAMQLSAGRARQFKQDMQQLLTRLQVELPPTFEAEAYQQAAARITRALDEVRTVAFEQLDAGARPHGFTLARSDQGLFMAPLGPSGQAATPEELAAMPPEQRSKLEAAQLDVDDQLKAALRSIRVQEHGADTRVLDLDRRTTLWAVAPLLDNLIDKYRADCPEAAEYLEEVRIDLVDHVLEFKGDAESAAGNPADSSAAPDPMTRREMTRYQVNLLVDQSGTRGAPVVVETNPTFMNLFGRIERDISLGENVLDFTMLRAGALHRANGGYIVLHAQAVLKDVNVWEALKRTLNNRQIVIEDPGLQLQMFSTRTLESEPIPLNVKVILLGPAGLYYDLYDGDEDFQRLFKVKADFASIMERVPANERAYAHFVRARCDEHGLPPFDAGAVAQIVEYGSRLAEDQKKLSTRFGDVADLIIEAAHWARSNRQTRVTAGAVRQALQERRYRSNLIEQEMQEVIIDGMIRVQVAGEVVGQINGLSVIEYGDYVFGQPSRISARTYVGRSGLIAIEREAHLSGRIHNKGVLILDGYLGGQYAIEQPLTLAASISFEQSYSEIEGDSASSTELYALLSSLANLPIKQSIAVTGSVDQLGRVQPVGGVQYKIEGFFDVCQARGLTGDQGVMIPASNVRNLMLREDVVQACAQGKFHIWAVDTIDAGLELLTGVKAGRRGKSGQFTRDSVHARVEARLKSIADDLDGSRKEREDEKSEEDDEKNGAEARSRKRQGQ